MIETIKPASREEWLEIRKSTVGSSEVPAVLGVHPWVTRYELQAIKTGQYERPQPEVEILENSIHLPPLERGNFIEDKAIELAKRLRPNWTIVPNTIPGGSMFIDRDLGLSCTPDAFAFVDAPGKAFPATATRGAALQIKTVASRQFEEHWRDEDGDIRIPLYAAVQGIVDAMLSGCHWAYVGALVIDYSIDFYLVEIPLDTAIMGRVREEVADFWRRVRGNDPYPPDFARDGDVIKRIYAEDNGSEIDLSGDSDVRRLVERRGLLKTFESEGMEAANNRKNLDTELIYRLGNATRAIVCDQIIEAKTIRRAGYEVAPTTYRTVKIKQRKI